MIRNAPLLGTVLGVMLLCFSAPAVFAAAATQAQVPTVFATPGTAASFPSPKIAVIDRQAILRLSTVGKDIMAQMETLSKQADQEFRGQQQALQLEAQNMQQQTALLSADVRAQKQKDLQAKEQAFQRRVEERQTQLQNALANAQRQVETALNPVLKDLMNQRGANLLLDRSAIMYATIDVDITNDVIARLDQVMPKVKLTLTGAAPAAPSAGVPAALSAKPAPGGLPPALRAPTKQ
jgi:outer membrane protein